MPLLADLRNVRHNAVYGRKVAQEVILSGEAALADGAQERPYAEMGAFVAHPVVLVLELAVAVGARVARSAARGPELKGENKREFETISLHPGRSTREGG